MDTLNSFNSHFAIIRGLLQVSKKTFPEGWCSNFCRPGFLSEPNPQYEITDIWRDDANDAGWNNNRQVEQSHLLASESTAVWTAAHHRQSDRFLSLSSAAPSSPHPRQCHLYPSVKTTLSRD